MECCRFGLHELIDLLLRHSQRRVAARVGTTPGFMAFTLICCSLRSTDQVRANERTAALVALYTLKAGLPVIETIEAFRTIAPLVSLKAAPSEL
jgi:hypothetical protein